MAAIRANFDKGSNLYIGSFLSSHNEHEKQTKVDTLATVTKQSIIVYRDRADPAQGPGTNGLYDTV